MTDNFEPLPPAHGSAPNTPMTSINDIIQWSANCLKRHGCAIINRRIFQDAKSRSAVVHAWTDEQVAEMIATQTKSQHRLEPDGLVLNVSDQ